MTIHPDTLVAIVYGLAVLGLSAFVVAARSRGVSVVPLILFTCLEITAVWPALLPTAYSLDSDSGTLAAVGLLAAAFCYLPAAGSRAQVDAWREGLVLPSEWTVRNLHAGLWVLVTALVALGVWRYRGPPPIIFGFSTLIDPAGSQAGVASIRESRLSLTKGHILLGDDYAGQGFLNALTEVGWQVVVGIAVLLLARRLLKRLWPCYLALALAFVFLASTGSRSPIILATLVGVLTVLFSRPVGTLSFIRILAVSSVVILLIMPLSKGAERGGETPGERIVALTDRVSDGNGRHNATITRLVDSGDLSPEYGGLFVEKVQASLPGVASDTPFAYRLTQEAYGGGANVTGYSTPTQYGLLYADWGSGGVIPGYMLTGLVLGLGWRYLLRIRHVVAPAIGSLGAMHLAYISVTGAPAVVITGVLVVVTGSLVLMPGILSRSKEESASADPPSAADRLLLSRGTQVK